MKKENNIRGIEIYNLLLELDYDYYIKFYVNGKVKWYELAKHLANRLYLDKGLRTFRDNKSYVWGWIRGNHNFTTAEDFINYII